MGDTTIRFVEAFSKKDEMKASIPAIQKYVHINRKKN